MQTIYDNTKKSRLTNTTRMSGKIYAKDLEKIVPLDEKDIGESSTEIFDKLSDKVVIELQNAMIEQYLDKKAQLISFLEDKIKENVDRREELAKNIGYVDEYDFGLNILKITNKLQAYREVLDFVKGNEKND